MKKIKVKVGSVVFGEGFKIIAGPCAIESEELLFETASKIAKYIDVLRGGAFKPRTRPDSFQGLGVEGLKILKRVAQKLGLPTITEVMDPRDVALVSKYTDILQIGARNMQNFPLLKEVGKTKKPVLLKRGFGNTIEEWLYAVEYIRKEGNEQIILCERGIRTFERTLRFSLDLAGAVWTKQHSPFPVIADPSHATGDPKLVAPLAKAIKSAGLDGVMIEVHARPEKALCDKEQALLPEEFIPLAKELRK
ncbi:3-deoxy-7-phosphoheptulonate synthase [bacterium]|nr:3-deoxy-7-phosphoheptulonate synthase [bacterium]